MTAPEATVVVPVHGAATIVVEQLDALRGQTVADRIEVIVVDDGSTDGTADTIEGWIDAHPEAGFTLVRRSRRGGTNASRNDGIRRASAPWVLLCDGDDVATPTWAEQMLDARRPNALLGGKCLLLGRDPEEASSWIGPEMRSLGWDYALGGNLGVPTELVRAVGGFDENMWAGGTEVEFAIRAQMAGAVVVPLPEAVILYRFPERPGGLFAKGFKRERGRAYARRKHSAVVSGGGVRGYVGLWRSAAASLVDLVRRRPRAAGHLGLLAGMALGRPFWVLRFRLRMPAPRMLDDATGAGVGSPAPS